MSFFNPPQVLCRYCELKKVRTFAVRNKRGFDLCQMCYDSQAKAERESDEFNEQFYKNQATMNKHTELQYVKNSSMKLRDELMIAEGQRDHAKMRVEALLVVNNDLARDNEILETERNEWKKKYEAAAVHGSRLRAYNESLVPLIEAAQELNNSYHDVYAVNKVRKAYQHIEDTWEGKI